MQFLVVVWARLTRLAMPRCPVCRALVQRAGDICAEPRCVKVWAEDQVW